MIFGARLCQHFHQLSRLIDGPLRGNLSAGGPSTRGEEATKLKRNVPASSTIL
jgi:hypothetical protein